MKYFYGILIYLFTINMSTAATVDIEYSEYNVVDAFNSVLLQVGIGDFPQESVNSSSLDLVIDDEFSFPQVLANWSIKANQNGPVNFNVISSSSTDNWILNISSVSTGEYWQGLSAIENVNLSMFDSYIIGILGVSNSGERLVVGFDISDAVSEVPISGIDLLMIMMLIGFLALRSKQSKKEAMLA